jgi:hypothetical protein
MTSTPHTNCLHPATSTARAKCRKDRAAKAASMKIELTALSQGYYDSTLDFEDIAARLDIIATRTQNSKLIEASRGYYEGTLEIETIMGMVFEAENAI